MFGVEPIDFYLAYHSKYIKDEHYARDLPHGAWVSISFRGHGSGKRAASGSSKMSAERLERQENEKQIEMEEKVLQKQAQTESKAQTQPKISSTNTIQSQIHSEKQTHVRCPMEDDVSGIFAQSKTARH